MTLQCLLTPVPICLVIIQSASTTQAEDDQIKPICFHWRWLNHLLSQATACMFKDTLLICTTCGQVGRAKVGPCSVQEYVQPGWITSNKYEVYPAWQQELHSSLMTQHQVQRLDQQLCSDCCLYELQGFASLELPPTRADCQCFSGIC